MSLVLSMHATLASYMFARTYLLRDTFKVYKRTFTNITITRIMRESISLATPSIDIDCRSSKVPIATFAFFFMMSEGSDVHVELWEGVEAKDDGKF